MAISVNMFHILYNIRFAQIQSVKCKRQLPIILAEKNLWQEKIE